jgi:hypothetical protein
MDKTYFIYKIFYIEKQKNEIKSYKIIHVIRII